MGKIVFSRTFECLEELAYFNRNIWDLDFRQLSGMDAPVNNVQISIADMYISAFSCDCMTDQGGEPPQRMYTFVYILPNSTPYVWKGVDVDPGSLILIGQNYEISAISRQGFDSLTFSIPVGIMQDMFMLESILDEDKQSLHSDRVIKLNDLQMDQLQAVFLLAKNIVENHGPPIDEILLQEMFLIAIRNILRFSYINSTIHVPRSRQLLMQILAHGREHAHKNLSVVELGQAFGITDRWLQSLFKSELRDVTPKSYLRSQRLYLAYRKLRQMKPMQGGVSHVAAELEFTNFSKFSRSYRELIGEPPSATLRRSSYLEGFS